MGGQVKAQFIKIPSEIHRLCTLSLSNATEVDNITLPLAIKRHYLLVDSMNDYLESKHLSIFKKSP